MKRLYFMQYKGRVFALEPATQTLITTAPNGAGQPRLVRATLDTLEIPKGRKHCRRAPIWLHTPLRLLIEHKLKQPVFPYMTPLTKPLVAFLAGETWTLDQQRAWEEELRKKNTSKKQKQRERKREKINKRINRTISQFDDITSREEELE